VEIEHIREVIKHIQQKADCAIESDKTFSEPTVRLTFENQPRGRQYFLSFFNVDNAGTLGLKIRWTLGEVNDFHEVLKCLVLNGNKFINQGTLYAAIIPKEDVGLFSLVGQMLFSPGTPAEEIATLWFNNAYLNYIFFDIPAPGVKMY
jgi:hypothetical protein